MSRGLGRTVCAGAFFAAACHPVVEPILDENTCVPTAPDPTRARAKRVVCSDELVGGDARVGDWLLQNALLTVQVRAEGTALTEPGAAGGTVLDILSPNANADVTEMVPLVDGTHWFADAIVSAQTTDDGAEIVVTGVLPDGTPSEVTYFLGHSSPVLEVFGASRFRVAPQASTGFLGDFMVYSDVLVTDGLLAQDDGGWFWWDDASYFGPFAETTLPELLPEQYSHHLTGGCDRGELVYLADEAGRIVQRISLSDPSGGFDAAIDQRATRIVCVAGGRRSSGWVDLSPADEAGEREPIELTVGDLGILDVRVTDDLGLPTPVAVWWNGGRWSLNGGSGSLWVGAGEGEGLVWGGPVWSVGRIPLLDVDAESAVDLRIRRELPEDVLLADFAVETWPHSTTRTSASSANARRVSDGVQWSVTVATNAVATTASTALNEDDLWTDAGARVETDAGGTIVSWPWTADSEQNQWGVPRVGGLDNHEALSVMARGRFTVVDTSWVTAAGPPRDWPTVPTAVRIDSIDDLPAYIALLDQWTAPALVGPLTYLVGVDRAQHAPADAERALLERRTVATNGPLVVVTPEPSLPAVDRPYAGGHRVRVIVTAPQWMQLDNVALIGPSGNTLADWTLGDPIDPIRLDTTVTLPAGTSWVMGVVTTESDFLGLVQSAPAWAVGSPVFLERPR